VVHGGDGDSALSDLDKDDDLGESPPAKRHKTSAVEMVQPPENTPGATELGSLAPEHSAVAEKEQAKSSRPPAPRRSKRKNLHYDAAAYKPSEDEVKDDEVVEEAKPRRSRTRRATKRSRTMEESSTNPPRSKKMRLGRSISVAGAGVVDSNMDS